MSIKTVPDEPTKKELRIEMLSRCNSVCCICQIPILHTHHIDLDRNNDTLENLAPLCPNCHTRTHSKSNMCINFTPDTIRGIRDKWYAYCEKRKGGINISGVVKLKVKNFVSEAPFANISWERKFMSIIGKEQAEKLKRDDIIDVVFSATNPTELETILESVKSMYRDALEEEKFRDKFKEICRMVGFDFVNGDIVNSN